MNPSIFSEWLERQGYTTIQTKSSRWVEVVPGIFQAFPYHHVIEPEEAEIAQMLRQYSVLGLRYSTPFHAPVGIPSYHVVLDGPTFQMEQVPKKARYDVRKGLSVVQVEPIPLERLAGEGWSLREDTLKRQKRPGAEKRSWWEKMCLSAEGLPGFEAWGALLDTQMVASMLTFVCDDCISILYQQSLSSYLRCGVNNALTFSVASEALERPGVKWVFYGLHSLDAPASVDHFKFRMGFTARPTRQRVTFHPLARPFFNRASYALLSRVARSWPGNSVLAKADGMVRFYIEGKSPAQDQALPYQQF